MALSKRERYIALVALTAVALLVGDRYIVTPVLNLRAQIDTGTRSMSGQMERAESLFSRRTMLGRKWNEMIAGGLKADPGEAESRVLHAMRDWADEAGLTLWSIKPERLEQDQDLQEIAFQASGTGSMSAVSRFLWHIETTKLPLRVEQLQVGARKEGTDALSLQLRVSTLYLAPDEQQTRETKLKPSPVEEG